MIQQWLYPLSDYPWFERCGLNYTAVWVLAFFWSFAFGACWGSFFNVCIWRIPRGESLSREPSHCGSCGVRIKWYDNIPIVSYLVLRGRCRSCKATYSPRYLIVELLCGTLFAAVVLKTGLTGQPAGMIFNYWVAILYCVGVAWIDAEYRIIPDKLSYPVLIIALASAVVMPSVWGLDNWLGSLMLAVFSGVFPALFAALFAIIGKLVAKNEVLGWGDVKFLLASGALIGLPGVFFALCFGSLTGMFYGVCTGIFAKRKFVNMTIPFGPFLAAGVIVWIFAGQIILKWYLQIGECLRAI